MNARVLRKWSLTKFLMYLWLPVIMLLVIWSQSAASMHLLANTGLTSSSVSPHYNIPLDNIMQNDGHLSLRGDHHHYQQENQQQQQRHHHQRMRPADRFLNSPVISNYNNQEPYEVFIRADESASYAAAANAAAAKVPKLNSQVINLNRLTGSANIEILNSNSQISGTSSSNNNFMRRLLPSATFQSSNKYNHRKNQQNYLNGFIISQHYPKNVETRIHERYERVLLPIIDDNGKINNRLPMIENDKNSNEDATRFLPDSINTERYKILANNERLLQQREKRARTEAHRRRLMRFKQLSTNNYDQSKSLLMQQSAVDINTAEKTRLVITSPIKTITTTITSPTITTTVSKQLIDNDLNKLMIGRNRRDSRSFSQLPLRQQRKRPRRYCSARDPTQLAFEAPTVFEGKIISMSYDRRSNFSVTFEVKEIFKKQTDFVLPHMLRLQFQYRNYSGECDIYRERMRPRGLVRDELEQGRIYILFVQQINSGNFTILGQPVKKTRRAVDAVRRGVSENYAQPATIKSLTASKTRVRNGEELRIVCRVRGQPPPKVTWFKDDRSINRNRKLYQFVHLKKRSELIVKSFNSSDAGLYECRAKNKVFRKPEKKTIRIEAVSRPADESYTHSTGDECTGDMEQYCLNGGTCQYFREIRIPSCECPDGFMGERCQEKEWNNVTPSTYQKEQQQCGENKYYGSYYC